MTEAEYVERFTKKMLETARARFGPGDVFTEGESAGDSIAEYARETGAACYGDESQRADPEQAALDDMDYWGE